MSRAVPVLEQHLTIVPPSGPVSPRCQVESNCPFVCYLASLAPPHPQAPEFQLHSNAHCICPSDLVHCIALLAVITTTTVAALMEVVRPLNLFLHQKASFDRRGLLDWPTFGLFLPTNHTIRDILPPLLFCLSLRLYVSNSSARPLAMPLASLLVPCSGRRTASIRGSFSRPVSLHSNYTC